MERGECESHAPMVCKTRGAGRLTKSYYQISSPVAYRTAIELSEEFIQIVTLASSCDLPVTFEVPALARDSNHVARVRL